MQTKGHNIKTTVDILDSLECAKEALALLPPLPPEIKAVYLRVLNAIYQIRDETGNARISDISKSTGILPPNTTKLINELVKLDIIEKTSSDLDKRVALVHTTKKGESYIQRYIVSFHKSLRDEFSKISKSDRKTMTDTIHKIYRAMKIVYQDGDI